MLQRAGKIDSADYDFGTQEHLALAPSRARDQPTLNALLIHEPLFSLGSKPLPFTSR